MTASHFRCPTCGYDLRSLPVSGDGMHLCPECGSSVHPQDRLAAWPGSWRTALWMCGPAAGNVLVLAVLVGLGGAPEWLIEFTGLVLIGTALGVPGFVLLHVREHYLPKHRRFGRTCLLALVVAAHHLLLLAAFVLLLADIR